MQSNNNEPRNYFKDSEIERITNRMNRIDPEGPNAHEKWKKQILADVFILVVFLAMVIYLFVR